MQLSSNEGITRRELALREQITRLLLKLFHQEFRRQFVHPPSRYSTVEASGVFPQCMLCVMLCMLCLVFVAALSLPHPLHAPARRSVLRSKSAQPSQPGPGSVRPARCPTTTRDPYYMYGRAPSKFHYKSAVRPPPARARAHGVDRGQLK